MSSPSDLILNSGILDSSVLVELSRWHRRVPRPSIQVPLASLPLLLERAFTDVSAVEVRETDMDAAAVFQLNRMQGILRIESIEGETTTIDCFAAFTIDGRILIPWVDDAPVADVLADCLVTFQPTLSTSAPFALQCPRELYLGDRKVFSLWEVAP